MPKITPDDLTADGFRAEQFGTPPNFDTPTTGYLAKVIDDASLRVMGLVGSVAYAATTTGIALARLRRAERAAAAAILWRRRLAYVDSNASHAADASPERNRREYLEHAAAAEHELTSAVDEFNAGGDGPGTDKIAGLSVGVVETGRFPRTVT